jgi:anti-anti-sigma factor
MGVTFTEKFLDNGVYLLSLQGTLDAPNAMTIEEQFTAALTEQGGQVIVELSGVDYMSSYGLRMLLVGAKALHSAGGGLHLAAPNEHVNKVIVVAGYDKMFPVHETLEEALASVNR